MVRVLKAALTNWQNGTTTQLRKVLARVVYGAIHMPQGCRYCCDYFALIVTTYSRPLDADLKRMRTAETCRNCTAISEFNSMVRRPNSPRTPRPDQDIEDLRYAVHPRFVQ